MTTIASSSATGGAPAPPRATSSPRATDGKAFSADAARALAWLLRGDEIADENEARCIVDLLYHVNPVGFETYRGAAQQFRTQWNRERSALKSGPGAICLEESVYKPWTSDRSHPLAGAGGLAWGDPAAHMTDVLERFGLSLSGLGRYAPDHLGALLEFLAFLIENRGQGDAACFCADHLDWLPALRAEAVKYGPTPILVLLLDAAERLVDGIASQIAR